MTQVDLKYMSASFEISFERWWTNF